MQRSVDFPWLPLPGNSDEHWHQAEYKNACQSNINDLLHHDISFTGETSSGQLQALLRLVSVKIQPARNQADPSHLVDSDSHAEVFAVALQ